MSGDSPVAVLKGRGIAIPEMEYLSTSTQALRKERPDHQTKT